MSNEVHEYRTHYPDNGPSFAKQAKEHYSKPHPKCPLMQTPCNRTECIWGNPYYEPNTGGIKCAIAAAAVSMLGEPSEADGAAEE